MRNKNGRRKREQRFPRKQNETGGVGIVQQNSVMEAASSISYLAIRIAEEQNSLPKRGHSFIRSWRPTTIPSPENQSEAHMVSISNSARSNAFHQRRNEPFTKRRSDTKQRTSGSQHEKERALPIRSRTTCVNQRRRSAVMGITHGAWPTSTIPSST